MKPDKIRPLEQDALTAALSELRKEYQLQVPALELRAAVLKAVAQRAAEGRRSRRVLASALAIATAAGVALFAWNVQSASGNSAGKQVLRAEDATNLPFVAIPYAPPVLEGDRLDVYRVRLPRAALAAYGVASPKKISGPMVKADLIVGNDGVARAVRFVP